MMGKKPHDRSVTTKACNCDYLQRATEDPENPIRFDARTCEYEFVYRSEVNGELAPATLVIYHCPFCGGAAPLSKRPTLFAFIERQEVDRLAEILGPINTIEDAIHTLGEPSQDAFSTTHTPESDESAPQVSRQRELTYDTLSDTAKVHICERRDGRIYWTLSGKFIGDTHDG